MYQYNLIISIFSKDEKLEQIIRTIKPLEKFTHQIEMYDLFDKEIIANSDIIIWDLAEEEIDKVVKTTKENAKIILCTNQYSQAFDKIDCIILKPFDYDFVQYSVKKILEKIRLEEDLYYTETCLHTAVDGSPDMFWIKSIDGIHTLLNKEFCNVVGKSKEDVTGKDHYYIWGVSKDDPNSGADVCKKTEDDVIAAGKTLRFSESVKSHENTRQLITYKSPLFDRNGKVIGTVGYGHDVTALKNLSVENEILLNSVPYAVLLRDNNGKIETINQYFETYFNISKNEIIGEDYHEWSEKVFYPERRINEGGFTEGKTRAINGEEKIVELRFKNICDIFDNVTGQVCIFRDVTSERKLEAQIIQNSNVDFMTQLYNRRYLDKFISEQDSHTTLTLFSVDLDHFKSINDTFGHKVGDEAIILTANTLKESFPNDLVVRMGGDEFLIVKAGNYSFDMVEKEAQQLLDNLANRFKESKQFHVLSASIGISQGVLEEIGIDLLLQHSDSALYKAKEQGRSCYFIYK